MNPTNQSFRSDYLTVPVNDGLQPRANLPLFQRTLQFFGDLAVSQRLVAHGGVIPGGMVMVIVLDALHGQHSPIIHDGGFQIQVCDPVDAHMDQHPVLCFAFNDCEYRERVFHSLQIEVLLRNTNAEAVAARASVYASAIQRLMSSQPVRRAL